MMTFLGRHVLPAHLAKQGSLIASWLNRCLREEHYLNYYAFMLMAVCVFVCVCARAQQGGAVLGKAHNWIWVGWCNPAGLCRGEECWPDLQLPLPQQCCCPSVTHTQTVDRGSL